MTMALDPNTKGHLEYMQHWDPTFPELMASLQEELDTILAEKYNGSLLNLFEKVAIRYLLCQFCLYPKSYHFCSTNYNECDINVFVYKFTNKWFIYEKDSF
jgi:hypothetical protein